MRAQVGLTMIELLIAAAILVVILGLVANGIQSGGGVVTQVVSESELLEDTRVAGQLIADSAARAVYVYPPGTTLSLNSAGSWTVQNPKNNKNVWKIGTDPMLAFIEAPRESSGVCVGTDKDGKKKLNEAACLSFVAYYPVKRATVAKQDNYKYLAEPQNEGAWMLFEYRKTLELTKLTADTPLPISSQTGLSGGQGRILADYLLPTTGFTLLNQVCRSRITTAEPASESAALCDDFKKSYDPFYLNTMSSGEFSLQAKVVKGRSTVTTPLMTFAVTPRNLY
jgi:type II secretory pathway pseudopilin PulG